MRLARKHTGRTLEPGHLHAAGEPLALRVLDDGDRARAGSLPLLVLAPDRRRALVEAEQRHAGERAARGVDPAMAERLVVRKDRRAGDDPERVERPPLRSVRPAGADEGVAAQCHRPRRRALEDLDDEPGVAADEIEEAAGPRLLGQLARVGVGALEDWQLAQLEVEALEPCRRMRDRAFRPLSRRRSRNDERRPTPGRAGEQAVLLLVAGVELVASVEHEQTRHDRMLWPCLNPSVSASRPAPPASRTSAPPAPRSTTCSSRARTAALSSSASTTPTWSATGPS